MTYYMIRHKATGMLMPLMKKNKGYTHWNPSNQEHKLAGDTGIPRLLKSERQALTVIRRWNDMPNATNKYFQSYSGEEDYDIDFKQDGRKQEDLEVIEVRITIKEKNA